VVCPSGSCVLQVKEYPKFFKDRQLGDKIYELTDIINVLQKTDGSLLPLPYSWASCRPHCRLRNLPCSPPNLLPDLIEARANEILYFFLFFTTH